MFAKELTIEEIENVKIQEILAKKKLEIEGKETPRMNTELKGDI